MSDSSKDFSGQTLKGKKFKGQDLSNADFSGANLTNARFLDCNLAGARFEKATLAGARFEEGTFANVTLAEADANRVRFKGIALQHVEASGCNFESSVFQKASMEDCRFSDCSFSSSALYRISIQGGSFEKCTLDQVRAPDAKMEAISFSATSFKRGDLVSWNVTDVRYNECDFSESDLSGARLSQVSFHACLFKQSEMIACDYEETTFDDCDFTKAIIKYSRGLSDETLAMIKERGGKVGLDLVRKTSNFLFYSNLGRLLLAAVVLGFVGFLAYRTFVPTSWSYEALRSEAAKARQEGNNELVKKYNEIILEKYADRPSRLTFALFELGQVLMEQQDYKNALPYLQQAYALNQDDPFAHPEIINGLADCTFNLKNYDEAQKWYQMMLDGIQDEGMRTSARLGLVRIYRQTKQIDKALAMIDQELANPDVGMRKLDFIGEKVELLKKLKRYGEALALLETQLESDNPESVRQAYFDMAMIERERGNQDRANAIFREMAKKFPEAQDFVDNSKINKAQQLIADGKVAEGEAMLKEAVQNSIMPQTRRHAKSTLAMHYLYSNNQDESEKLFLELFKEARPEDFDYATLRINYAVLKRMQGKVDESLKILNEVIENNSGDPSILRWTHSERASSHQNNGDIPAAVADLHKALEYTKENEGRVEAILSLIQMAALHGSTEDAVALAKKYDSEITEPVHRERFLELLARAYVDQGQYQQGIKIFDKLIDSCEPDSSCKMRYTLEKINLMAGQGEKESAFMEFKKVIDWDITADLISPNCNLINGLFPDIEGADQVYIQYYNKLIQAYRKKDILDENYFTLLNNLGRLYQFSGETEKADELYQEVINRSESPWPLMQAYENMFNHFVMTADYDAARETAEALVKKVNTRKGKILSNLLLANLYAQTDRTDEAVDLLKKTLNECEEESDCCRVLDSLMQQYRIQDERVKMRGLYDEWKEKTTDCWVIRDVKTELNIE